MNQIQNSTSKKNSKSSHQKQEKRTTLIKNLPKINVAILETSLMNMAGGSWMNHIGIGVRRPTAVTDA